MELETNKLLDSQSLKQELESYREALLQHELYPNINTLEALQVFMKHHIYAVWDFMSLLKALQQKLSCTTIPWIPQGEPEMRRLINDIVRDEESDLGFDGQSASHYEIYLDAMQEAGADTSEITSFIEKIRSGESVAYALDALELPSSIKEFVNFTFETIAEGNAHVIAAVFTFGREDLIPDMFTQIVRDLNSENKLDKFVYYLERHIELDGDEHGPLALRMIKLFCGDDPVKWEEALIASQKALALRIKLWDGIQEEILELV
ncbi:DUF3050 domain-containing protein [Sediminitomix flava]|uniref:DUF3050 family protein n=1 Tax=Sediminitomix flava TaxID=379075 RepID=A0A315ZJX1_SEDFL|nr:DUF3050 domain-containing protein [Sediminitomix flava]PWJ34211.1 Protein of unknown function (DUF3050) [Sediminitomix flava]